MANALLLIPGCDNPLVTDTDIPACCQEWNSADLKDKKDKLMNSKELVINQ
jgi:hypothetical protein